MSLLAGRVVLAMLCVGHVVAVLSGGWPCCRLVMAIVLAIVLATLSVLSAIALWVAVCLVVRCSGCV